MLKLVEFIDRNFWLCLTICLIGGGIAGAIYGSVTGGEYVLPIF